MQNITEQELLNGLCSAIATNQDRVVIDMPVAEFVKSILDDIQGQRNTAERSARTGRE